MGRDVRESSFRSTSLHPEPQTLQMAEDSALGGGSKHRVSHHLGQTWDFKALSRLSLGYADFCLMSLLPGEAMSC